MASHTDDASFCSELQVRTKNIHDESDKLVNLKLALVLTDINTFAHVLADFYFVYQAMEVAIEQNEKHPHIGPVIFPDLYRTTAFEQDLLFYLGQNWKSCVQPSPPAKLYCERIQRIAKEDPVLLIAYIHSMYLAILSGGQIIKRIIKRTLGLQGEEGLAIFEFATDNQKQLRDNFKAAIDRLALDRTKKDAIIAEKIKVFQMNNAIARHVKPTIASSHRLLKLFLACLSLLALLLFLLTKLLW